jgi:3-hydroxyisobutyrate dehydrogenase
MGLPMAENLLKAGYEVFGINRSQPAELKLATIGGNTGYTCAQLAEDMDMIITCLPMPADVEEVYLGVEGLIKNGSEDLILVDCSTVNPSLNAKINCCQRYSFP